MSNGDMDYSYGLYYAHKLAISEAAFLRHEYVDEEHEVIGILAMSLGEYGKDTARWDEERKSAVELESGAVKVFLESRGISPGELKERMRGSLDVGECIKPEDGVYHRSERCRDLFARAEELAEGNATLSCLHLLAAFLERPSRPAAVVFEDTGMDVQQIREDLADFLRSKPQELGFLRRRRGKTEYIDRYGRDITREARTGGLGTIVGREEELLKLERALLNVKKNAILVGESGVGKNTIVEGLVERIIRVRGATELSSVRVVKLSIQELLKGEEVKPGRLLERLMKMIVEARENRNIVFYIDDIQLLLGDSGSSIGREISNILMPALLNGDIRCILTADTAGYVQYIKDDPRLLSKFLKIDVNEPSREESLEIIDLTRVELEQEYPVKITRDALEAAVDLSAYFEVSLCLPEKAVDLLHEACAQVRLPGLSRAHNVDTLYSMRWDAEMGNLRPLDTYVIDKDVIAAVVADRTGLPLEIITQQLGGSGIQPLNDLEEFLKERIVGQDSAVEEIVKRLVLSYSGLSERKGPLATFLFLGPTGVGKTETAKLIADHLFGDASYLTRMDMSEYMEQHSVSKLIGSPPGYVGYEEEGLLTGWLRSRPHSVVLLDEIEKAHPKVFDLFLQVFDDARITDSKGRTAEAKNTIFIMTSNLMSDGGRGDEAVDADELRNRLEESFRKEFLNRIDRIILFRSLDNEDVKRIIRPMIERIRENLAGKYGIGLDVDEKAMGLLARAGYNRRYGARDLKRTIEKKLEEPLSGMLFRGDLKDCARCRVTASGDELEMTLLGP